jgi:hypothetical protein
MQFVSDHLFQFNDEIPGYATRAEAEIICGLVASLPVATVLETGSFTGKLTWSLCKTFPKLSITALDIWANNLFVDRKVVYDSIERDQRFLGQKSNVDFFMRFNQEHNNLSVVRQDFFSYNLYHDVIIVGIDAKEVPVGQSIEHALSLRPKMIVGRHAHPPRKDVLSGIAPYNPVFFDRGVYLINVSSD